MLKRVHISKMTYTLLLVLSLAGHAETQQALAASTTASTPRPVTSSRSNTSLLQATPAPAKEGAEAANAGRDDPAEPAASPEPQSVPTTTQVPAQHANHKTRNGILLIVGTVVMAIVLASLAK